MSFTTETLIFESSEAFRNDPRVATPTFDIVLKADGVHAPVYYGKQIGEPSTHGYVFISTFHPLIVFDVFTALSADWDSFESHKALIDGPSFPAVLEALQPSVGGKATMYHVKFSGPTIAFEMPVTEVLTLTLKASENRASVVDILSKISEASEKTAVFGQTREDENKYVLVRGWPSVEAHWETAKKSELVAELGKLYSLANKDHLHDTKLLQYWL
ncbi:hypothetical protein OG21DRAFT_1516764 [Imleria badia]|nr:hypothetical protein OG21DRAFT_1516764 [Imleria badia]